MEKITKDIEVTPGVVSLMRKSVKRVIQIGAFMIAVGSGLTAYSLVKNTGYELTSVYSLLITSGAAMISAALASKAWQSQAESRESRLEGPPSNEAIP